MAANELLQRSLSPANRLRSPESSTAATGPLKTVAGGSANLISEFESEGHGPANSCQSSLDPDSSHLSEAVCLPPMRQADRITLPFHWLTLFLPLKFLRFA